MKASPVAFRMPECAGLRLGLVSSAPRCSRSGVASIIDRLDEGLRAAGVEVLRLVSDSAAMGDAHDQHQRVASACRAMERFRPNLVHLETTDPVAEMIAAAARHAAVPISVTFLPTQPGGPHQPDAEPDLSGLLRLYRRSELTVALADREAAWLTQHEARRVVTLPRGVDSDRFSPRRRDGLLRASWQAGPDTPVALFVGRLVAEKDPELLIRSLHAAREAVPHLAAVVVGDGPERERLAKSLPWAIFPGSLSGELLIATYASADFLIFPSPHAYFGNVVLEALASGLAVVAFAQAAAQRCIRHDVDGLLVPSGDDGAFIAATVSLAVNEAHRRQLMAAAPGAVASLSWATVAPLWATAFSALVRDHSNLRTFIAPRREVPATPTTALESADAAVQAEAAGRDDEAIALLRRALAGRPDLAAVWSHLGNLLARRGEHAAADFCLRHAVALAPQDPTMHVQLGQFQLAQGRWSEGWEHLAWRTRQPGRWLQPEWSGCDPAGWRLLLYADGSLGDTLQNLRFAAALDAWGAKILVAVQPRVQGLCQAVLGRGVVALRGTLPAYDLCYPLSLVAGRMGMRPELVPPPPLPPVVDAQRRRQWSRHLAQDGRLRVGLCWQSTEAVTEKRHLFPAGLLDPLKNISGVRWFSLQRGSAREESRHWSWLEDPGDAFDAGDEAFADTCAALPDLDLIVTTDNDLAHVAGLLRRPTWLLLPFLPDGRWLLDRQDTPWYPSLQLLRQPRPGDWDSVMQQVVARLRDQPRQADDSA